jgi:hypothetical protein
MDSARDTAEAVGCPIRKPTDRSLLAAPRGLSQRAASFVASQCQGIHQMPFRRLISTFRMRRAQEKAHRATPPPERIRQDASPTQPPAVPCGATDLSGRPRSQILFTCQRSHTAPWGPVPVFSLADILSPGRQWSLKVILRHPAPLSWWRRTGSNRRPHACKARALPTELRPLFGTRRSGGPGKT